MGIGCFHSRPSAKTKSIIASISVAPYHVLVVVIVGDRGIEVKGGE